ncbi:hypothetical protein ACRYJU_04465 [Alloalcanivorax xenomutans]|uniref:Uncharacterized protein n=1 Tax=Alcanivorax xiamenensis TaxID=1177156 RepID=A0ABQ6Y3P8_9GAMM|nr:hypothetical protein [Alcanivorax xiamenensis]KAF0803510.1 hypothetical protein A6D6_03682 [Alcanivorax xiamenensis]
MGYHVYIIREDGQLEAPIEWEEVESAIAGDQNYSWERKSDYVNIQKRSASGSFYFIYQSGRLYIKNPSKNQIREFVGLSELLKGRVIGEYFESYRPSGEIYVHEDDAEAAAQYVARLQSRRRKGRRKKVVWRAAIVVLGAVLGVLMSIFTKGSGT